MLGAVFAMISLADLAVATAIAAGARSQSLAPLIEVVILPVIENGAAKAPRRRCRLRLQASAKRMVKRF